MNKQIIQAIEDKLIVSLKYGNADETETYYNMLQSHRFTNIVIKTGIFIGCLLTLSLFIYP